MNNTTFQKIRMKSNYLKRIFAAGNYQNYELFDQPYKLAIRVLECGSMSDDAAATYLNLNVNTVSQVRRALEG
jgi:hypothetical protein